jgi:hypothetical protein
MGVRPVPFLLIAACLALPAIAAAQNAAPAAPAPVSAPASAGASANASAARPSALHAAPSPARNGKAATPGRKSVTQPLWRELSPGQQQALAPLATHWDTLNVAQKRKWIALSSNFPRMSGEEQAKLHSRMTEWASLSPQQRSIARLNYGAARKISADDKKAKWEAYQALSPEEKKKLASKATKPPSTAAALKPAPAGKLAVVPKPEHRRPANTKAPRIAAAPSQVDRNTLLPQPNPSPSSNPTLPPQAGTPD